MRIYDLDRAPSARRTTAPATQPTWWRRTLGAAGAYALGILIGIDVLANAILFGRPYQTISCRIGESIENGGWASHVHWPAWWVAHCESSIYETTV